MQSSDIIIRRTFINNVDASFASSHSNPISFLPNCKPEQLWPWRGTYRLNSGFYFKATLLRLLPLLSYTVPW
jgi:hypothetical protein